MSMNGPSNIPAGWYPDPQNGSMMRYWDGSNWTANTQPAAAPAPQAPQSPYGSQAQQPFNPNMNSPYPNPMYGAPAMQKPDNYLIKAILSTVCCCIPLGIPAIIFASKVDSSWNSGNYEEAAENAAKAKKFTTWAVIGGVVAAVLSFGLQFLAAMAEQGTM